MKYISYSHTLMTQTAIAYTTATLNNISGEQIKIILEDIADNLYHPDSYHQQGGDMVRVGGLTYTLDIAGGPLSLLPMESTYLLDVELKLSGHPSWGK